MILFLSGSINSGKSTVARLLVERVPRTALVEIDVVRDMVPWMPLEDSIPLNWTNAMSLIRNFVKADCNVVVPYPLSRANYERVMRELADIAVPMHVVTLAPRKDIALTNRGTRELDDWERGRIEHHYNIGINAPAFGHIIDNSAQTVEETVGEILQIITEVR